MISELLSYQIALTSKLKTMGYASMAPNLLFYVTILATLCIKGLTLVTRPSEGQFVVPITSLERLKLYSH